MIGKAGDSGAPSNGSLVLAVLVPRFCYFRPVCSLKFSLNLCLNSPFTFSHLDSDSWRLLELQRQRHFL